MPLNKSSLFMRTLHLAYTWYLFQVYAPVVRQDTCVRLERRSCTSRGINTKYIQNQPVTRCLQPDWKWPQRAQNVRERAVVHLKIWHASTFQSLECEPRDLIDVCAEPEDIPSRCLCECRVVVFLWSSRNDHADHETSPDFPSSDDRISIFWNIPFSFKPINQLVSL